MVPDGWTFWGALALACALEMGGDLALKQWAETDRAVWLIAGVGVYTVALVLFATLLRRAELGVIFVLWTGIAAVFLTAAGWLFFDEVLSAKRLLGLALVIGGAILLRL
jgi:multidrug transporter EmrE-like cation transporter